MTSLSNTVNTVSPVAKRIQTKITLAELEKELAEDCKALAEFTEHKSYYNKRLIESKKFIDMADRMIDRIKQGILNKCTAIEAEKIRLEGKKGGGHANS